MEEYVLDHLENIKLRVEGEDSDYEARMALARLAGGLFWLHEQVLRLERQARFSAQQGDVLYELVGELLKDGVAPGFLSCAFQWYAVSACNYVRLVGWLATRDSKQATEYVRSVLPTVHEYRNKVAAHFAATAPRDDNPADLFASLLTQVVYVKGYLCAGALSQSSVNGETHAGVSRNLSWSVTHIHTKLRQRYWPTGMPPVYGAIRLPGNSTTSLEIRLPDEICDELGLPKMPTRT